jgi:hypothetical protein
VGTGEERVCGKAGEGERIFPACCDENEERDNDARVLITTEHLRDERDDVRCDRKDGGVFGGSKEVTDRLGGGEGIGT